MTLTSLRSAAAASALATITVVATLGSPPSGATPTTSAPLTSATGAQVPELSWEQCADGIECASATVPLDYDELDGPTTQIALSRIPAGNPEERIGSLFINPGGPGGGGVEFISQLVDFYPASILDHFDLVGFDPRFVANSDPLRCFASDAEWQQFVSLPPDVPVGAAQEQEAAVRNAELSDRCQQAAPDKVQHMSSINVAKDLDVLRAAVGDEKLNFVGYSYGTFLGQIYANLFPDKLRAVVLDGVIDPREWSGQGPDADDVPVLLRTDAPVGTWKAMRAFFAECDAAAGSCAFGAGDARGHYNRLLTRLNQHPVPPNPQTGFPGVTYAQVVSRSLRSMYSPFAWPGFAGYLAQVEALAFPEGVGARRPASSFRLDVPTYPNTAEAFLGVICTDARNPVDATAWARAGAKQDRRTPYVGRAWAWLSHVEACATWARDDDRYAGPWDTTPSAPILLVGGRFDPATPYDGARSVDHLLPRTRLLTLSGYGHTSLNAPNQCALDRTAAYLVSLELPPIGTVCDPLFGPFDQGAARTAGARLLVRPVF